MNKGHKFIHDIMAAAEARAAWQRTANRCFMQEDAKRAPKLACCPGAASSIPLCDSFHCDSGNGVNHPTLAQLPIDWNSNMNMSPETRWWLQWQPSFGNQRDFMCEILKDKKYQPGYVEMNYDITRTLNSVPDRSGNANEHEYSSLAYSTAHDKKREDNDLKNQNIAFRTMDDNDIRADNSSYDTEQPREGHKSCEDSGKNIVKTEDLAILEGYEKYPYDMTTSRSRCNGGLWWRTADENELATLVAQKSSEHIENCDLPPPQSMQIRKVPLLSSDELCYSVVSEPVVHSQEKLRAIRHNASASSLNISNQTSPFSDYGNMDSVPLSSSESHSSTKAGDRAPRSGRTIKTWTVGRQGSESEREKADLLEALCHSQTRAREAEIAAARAFSEKDRLLRLFLKEASHLFAYRQWLRLLQIETLYLKIKAKDQSVSWDQLRALLPRFPLMPSKQRWVAAKTSSNKLHKIGQQKFGMITWALTLALGLSLAGAGLFLGWSMEWFLPMF